MHGSLCISLRSRFSLTHRAVVATSAQCFRIVTRFQSWKKAGLNWIYASQWLLLSRALLGGGAFERPPSGFSRIAKKRRRAAPPGFHPPYPPSFPQLLWKFRPNAMWGQVTRSGQVTQLQNKFPIAPRLQCFRESYETFGIWWGHQCLQNVYLGFFYIGDLRSGHFCDLPIISQWAKNQPCYIYFGASVFEWNHIV